MNQKLTSGSDLTRWYVFRCRAQSRVAEILSDSASEMPFEVFMPYRDFGKDDTYNECFEGAPVWPGYMFVKGHLDYIHRFFQKNLLVAWPIVQKTDANPVMVHDAEVAKFRFILKNSQQAEVHESDYPNEKKDDKVRILEGRLKGTEGYLRAEQGRKGQLVIVPIEAIGQGGATSLASVSFRVSPEHLAIISFAKDGHRAIDRLGKAMNQAILAFERYVKSEPLRNEEILRSYLLTYQYLQVSTLNQRVKLRTIFYLIHTVLGQAEERESDRKVFDEELIPELKVRYDKASPIRKDSARWALEELRQTLRGIDAAFETMSVNGRTIS